MSDDTPRTGRDNYMTPPSQHIHEPSELDKAIEKCARECADRITMNGKNFGPQADYEKCVSLLKKQISLLVTKQVGELEKSCQEWGTSYEQLQQQSRSKDALIEKLVECVNEMQDAAKSLALHTLSIKRANQIDEKCIKALSLAREAGFGKCE